MEQVLLLGNRYEIREKIGSGGMADVYLGYDTKLNRKVAVKILHKRLAADTVFVERFKREAQAAANLSHPNIVSIYDWGQHEESYYIVMEILAGKTLKEIVTEKGPLPPNEAIEFAVQACSALSYAHENKIIHRDIKPQNIVVSPDGHLKVTDFGIARNGDEGATMTQTGTMMGTPQYFSPEQAQGHVVGKSSDIYSLGICIYEMLTGQPPFSGDSAVAIAYKQVYDTPEKPSDMNPDINPDLEKVVLKALAKNPDERYLNAEDLAADLRKVLAGIPVRTEEAPYDANKTVFMPPVDSLKDQTQAVPGTAPKRAKTNNKKMLPWIVLLGILAIILGYIASNQLPIIDFFKVKVPDVEGRKLEDAEKLLTEQGFKVELSKESSDEVPIDKIISQDPVAGTMLKKGGTVKLIVSTGEPLIEVPDLRKFTLEEAEDILAREELMLGEKTYRESENYAKGEIISQWPQPGKNVKKETKINLVVNKGIQNVTVPELIGLPYRTALKQLSNNGLIESGTRYEFSDKDKDTVIKQSPASGTSVIKYSKVSLLVSKGTEFVVLPDLYLRPVEVAKKDLEGLGLKVSTIDKETTKYSNGTVLSQEPAPGVEVKPGDTVTLIVSKQPKKTTPTTSAP